MNTRDQIKPGTAVITPRGTELFVVNWMWPGSWLLGEQCFSSEYAARQFCAERKLRIAYCRH